jgi:hypothetical protein
MDGDGDIDVLMAFGMGFSGNAKSEQVAWYENDGTPSSGSWKKHIIRQGLVGVFEVVTADFDGDTDLDVVTTLWNGPGQVVWFENSGNPTGRWTMHLIKDKWRRANQVITADLDGDGKLDIVAGAERGSNEVRWWRNLGRTKP